MWQTASKGKDRQRERESGRRAAGACSLIMRNGKQLCASLFENKAGVFQTVQLLSSLFAALIAICAAFKFAIMQRTSKREKAHKRKRESNEIFSREKRVNAAGKVNINAKHKQS